MSGPNLDIFSVPTALKNYFARLRVLEKTSKQQKHLNYWSFTIKGEFILLSREGKKKRTVPSKKYVLHRKRNM